MSWFADLRKELKSYPPEQLMEWFTDPGQASKVAEDDRQFWLEEVAARIAQTSAGVSFLLRVLPNVDEPRLRAIVVAIRFARRLSDRRRAQLCSRMMGLLRDPRSEIIANVIDTLGCLNCQEAMDQVLALRNHSSPYVVGSVLRFLSRHSPEKARPLLEEALHSPEPIIRQNAVDELDGMGCMEALPQLRRLMEDADEDVRQAARTAVDNLEARTSTA